MCELAQKQTSVATTGYSSGWVDIDGTRRKYLHQWGDIENHQATIYVVHGLGEHGARYHNLAMDFAERGFRVVSFDQQGHGHSPERRGCIQSYDSLLDDIEAFLRWEGGSPQGKPKILFGHSMGGNLVLNYAMRREYLPTAVVSSSPMIRASRPPGRLFERTARLIAKLAPNLQLRSVPKVERLMSDPNEQAALENDELFHTQLSLRLGGALLDTGRWVLQNADKLAVPTLLSHGTQDCLTCPWASKEFSEKAGQVCRLLLLPEQLHDPFRDLQRKAVIDEFHAFLRPWVEERSA